MTDRFSAQLRQHLLDTANEHPADGQHAAVVDAVATTRQRLPLVARLTWNPGRIGLVPSAAVRFGLVAASLALAMGAGAMLAGGPNPATVFEGTWTSTDSGDGSAQILVVGPGSSPDVYFEDGYATGAACVNDVVKRFTARGVGEISGNRLLLAFPDGGGCGLITVELGGDLEYVAASDTLVGADGLVWSRPLDRDPSRTAARATQAPVTQPPATQAPVTQPTSTGPGEATFTLAPITSGCIEFLDGGIYTAAAGPMSLSATVVGGPETYWHGLRDTFYLLNAPCSFGGPVWLEATVVGQVYADACDLGTSAKTDTAADVIAALAAQTGVEVVGPTDMTLDGHEAARFDVAPAAGPDTTACTDGIQLFDGVSNMDPDQTLTVYVIDVDGVALALVVYWSENENENENENAALPAEVDAIVASLRIQT